MSWCHPRALLILTTLHVCQNTAEWRYTNATSHDDALIEIVESARWCAVRPVDTDFDLSLFTLLGKISQFRYPVPISLDVKCKVIVDTSRHSERMPLEVR